MSIAATIKAIFAKFAPTKRIEECGPMIERWKAIYSGNPEWAETTIPTIESINHKHELRRLNAAEIVCHEVATLVWAEPAAIEAGKFIAAMLADNGFNDRFDEKIEFMAALGGFCLKPIVKDGRLLIEFVYGDRFLPTHWNGAGVYGGKFFDRQSADGKKYVRVESHIPQMIPQNGVSVPGYQVTNELFLMEGTDASGANAFRAVSLDALYPDMDAVAYIASDVPLFAYVRTPEANNADMDSPMGISFFHNAIDTCRMLDETFDALGTEIKLGRKRVIVPASSLRPVVASDGTTRRYFDPKDEVYQAFDFEDAEKQKLIDNSATLRVDDISTAIQAQLDLLALQIGFTPGTFTFTGGAVKTATEVISQNSKTFKTVKAFQRALSGGIRGMIQAAWAVADYYQLPNVDRVESIGVKWDDSIIEDRGSDANYWRGLTTAELASKKQAIMAIHKVDEAGADKIIAQIEKERPAMVDLGTFGSGDTPPTGDLGAAQ